MNGAALPRRTLLALADAFADEVAERLPDLHASLADALTTGDPASARIALRHVHTLASGAAVVGADAVSRHARHCEELLLDALGDNAAASPAFDQAALDRDGVLAEVEAVALLLAPWLVRGAA